MRTGLKAGVEVFFQFPRPGSVAPEHIALLPPQGRFSFSKNKHSQSVNSPRKFEGPI